jgi:hypothetical protein
MKSNVLEPLANYGRYGLHILKCPSGKYAFFGTIPIELCIEKTDRFGQITYTSPLFNSYEEGKQYFDTNKPTTV